MKKIAVHLHLYYINMWPLFEKILKNIEPYPYDLYVTYCKESKILVENIKNFKRDTHFLTVENRGYDIGPFFDFLHAINLDEYDYIIKLHTKNNQKGTETKIKNRFISREMWFYLLTNSLLGTPQQFHKNILAFEEDEKLGMIGSSYLIMEEKNKNIVQFVLRESAGIFKYKPKNQAVFFVAGTMFMVRANLLKILKSNFQSTAFEMTNPQIRDNTKAHIMERLFGFIVLKQGYFIKGFDGSLYIEYKMLLNTVKRFIYSKKITKKQKVLIKIFKIPVWYA